VPETPGAARKINSLEDAHCVRDAGVAGSNLAIAKLYGVKLVRSRLVSSTLPFSNRYLRIPTKENSPVI
jgi:hypothetical protein